jgi:hypothetical protein
MNAVTPSQEERAEVAAVLQSGIFRRAPVLESFFRYVCDRYFEAQASQVKEYSIAVEALGRPQYFDSKKDSIVRVEAHHLRKRLQQYYAGEGASHKVHIVLPQGQYVPEFVFHGERPPTPVEGASGTESQAGFVEPALDSYRPDTPIPETARPTRRMWISGFALLAVILGVVIIIGLRHRVARAPAPKQESWTGPASGPVPMEFRMLAGYHGPPVTDADGKIWNRDAYYKGGVSSSIPENRYIDGQPEPHFIRSQRSGTFEYVIPLRQGVYELHLYFAETEYGGGNPRGEGIRPFNVSINGTARVESVDPLAEAGAPNRMHARIFKDVGPASDGNLHLKFYGWTDAFVNAVEILPGVPGRIRPIRIVMQPNAVTDTEGHVWSADEFFVGGSSIVRHYRVGESSGKPLLQGERYGNFAYHIPLAPGKYRLTLHFAETWWGTPESHEGAENQRVFSVFANGVALLRSFEVAKEAGGPYRAVEKSFDGLEPNAQGILALEFVPSKNYAEINAIEVVETQ